MIREDKKALRSHCLWSLAVVILWACWVGCYLLNHVKRFGMVFYQFDKMVLLFSVGVLLMALVLLGINWNISVKAYMERYPICLLLLLLLGSLLIVYHSFLYANRILAYTDIGADTSAQYVPVMQMIVDKIKARDFSMWEFNWGLGVDISNNQSLVFDFFNIPIYAAGVLIGHQAMLYTICLMQMLKCLLLGWGTWKFLSCFSNTVYARVVASYLSVFCGFMMLWGEHYFMASACVWYLLIIYLIERSFWNAAYSFRLILAVAAALVFSLYSSYMIAVSCAAYVVLRLLSVRKRLDRSARLAILARLVGSVILAASLAAVILLPVYYQLTQVTGRLDGDQNTFALLLGYLRNVADPKTLHNHYLRLFSNNLEGIGNAYSGIINYYESEQLFFSCMCLPFLGMFFSERMIRREDRLLTGAAGLLLLYSVLFPAISFLYNRLVNTATRYSYVYIPVAAYVFAYVLSRLKTLHRISVAIGIGIAGCSALYLCWHLHTSGISENLPYLWSIPVILLWGSLCMLFIHRSAKDTVGCRAAYLLLAVGICWNAVQDGYFTINRTDTWNREGVEAQEFFGVSTAAAQNFIREENQDVIYRSEKAYPELSGWNDSILQNYAGMTYYNTTYNKYVEQFMRLAWPEVLSMPQIGGGYVAFSNDPNNIQMASLLGIRYVLAQNEVIRESDYLPQMSLNEEYSVFENEEAASLGILFDQILSEEEFTSDAYNPDQRRKLLEDTVVVDLNQLKSVDDSKLTSEVIPAQSAALAASDGTWYAKHSVPFTKQGNDGTLAAHVETSENQLLFVSVPYDTGWRVWVNGEEKTLLRADVGFLAVPISAGSSDIVLRYQTPMMEMGMICSVMGMIVYVITLMIYRKMRKRNE